MSYCHIVAPVDGIVNQRSAEVGARISQGQQLIVVVQIDSVWANANLKEAQLKKMHVGQRVTISVDWLGESFEGQKENMPAATGDRSSLFPPENATGNYVTIVQRLPVQMRFNPNQWDLDKLSPGESVDSKVSLGLTTDQLTRPAIRGLCQLIQVGRRPLPAAGDPASQDALRQSGYRPSHNKRRSAPGFPCCREC
jgi:multidrug resistance efflux pump